ncbi:MAG: DEAD/DEAH box helicase, partial [Propionibacteriaceae bacterium]|nr:DEAD/DEAH box helicase [Propionibacteriaceae bacterium]
MTETRAILDAAVAALGGQARDGQRQMAQAIDDTVAAGGRLLVQAGTGTGKSLAYLAPAAAHLVAHPSSRVVVATATLALQTQLATKDIPLIVDATAQATGHEVAWTLLKGRSNYACLLKVRDQAREDDQAELLEAGAVATALKSSRADALAVLGAEVVALRRWAEEEAEAEGAGDRDDAPSHSAKAWAQVSTTSHECLGAQRCPHTKDCFAELARERARRSDLVVTNHALVAVDAELDTGALPDHDLVVLDEAHELSARVTGAATKELSPQMVDRVAQRAAKWLKEETADALRRAANHLRGALEAAGPGRVVDSAGQVAEACREVAGAGRDALSELAGDKSEPERTQAALALDEV